MAPVVEVEVHDSLHMASPLLIELHYSDIRAIQITLKLLKTTGR